jgi:hypothetical protein
MHLILWLMMLLVAFKFLIYWFHRLHHWLRGIAWIHWHRWLHSIMRMIHGSIWSHWRHCVSIMKMLGWVNVGKWRVRRWVHVGHHIVYWRQVHVGIIERLRHRGWQRLLILSLGWRGLFFYRIWSWRFSFLKFLLSFKTRSIRLLFLLLFGFWLDFLLVNLFLLSLRRVIIIFLKYRLEDDFSTRFILILITKLSDLFFSIMSSLRRVY